MAYIRSLQIRPRYIRGPRPKTTLLALLALARCAKLRRLGLSVDASHRGVRDKLRNLSPCWRNDSLRILDVGSSPISYELAASFLESIFMNLEDIESHRSRVSKYHRRWQTVAQLLLLLLSKVRGRSIYYDPWRSLEREWRDGITKL